MPSPEPGTFRRIGERQRVKTGFIDLVTGTFLGPDGFTFEREIVRHPGAVVIVPLDTDGGRVRCVRQYRAAVDRYLLELPAGKLDVPGEPAVDCAARELAEEVGYAAAAMQEIGHFYNSPGFTDERSTVFVATGLTGVARHADGVEERHLELEWVELDALDRLIDGGELEDAKSIIGLQMARRYAREPPDGQGPG
jgi:8-oxo-dGTP pyrophosphatase MutT (NUDIX family)